MKAAALLSRGIVPAAAAAAAAAAGGSGHRNGTNLGVSGHAHIGTEPLSCSPAIFPLSPLTLIRREAAINWQEGTGTQEVLAGGDILTGRRCWQTGTYLILAES